MSARNSRSNGTIRKFGRMHAPVLEQGLLDLRLESYRRFLERGVAEALQDLKHIEIDMPWKLSLSLSEPELGEAEMTVRECIEAGRTYDAPLTALARLRTENGEVTEQRLLLCRLPLMDAGGGFVVSGVRRVVIHQIIRAPGVWFSSETDSFSGVRIGKGRVSPARGPWIGFETNERDELRVRLNGGNSLSGLAVLRIYGFDDDRLLECFKDMEGRGKRQYVLNSMLLGDCDSREEALLQIYDEVSPGAPPNLDTAEERVERLFFDRQLYSLSAPGRYMLNRRFGGDSEDLLLTPEDIENIVRHLIDVSNGDAEDDDIDHLANRRVRTAGELVQEEFAAGLFDMVKATTEALQLAEYEPSRPRDCLKSLALVKRIAGFFNGSKLCQVTDETNPIAELTHKRRITSLGPGGLNRQNAGVDPRDVHHTHYGKICPIETPEGKNIGLLCTLAIAADVDEHGLLTTPVRPVRKSLSSHSDDICGRTLREDIVLDGAVLERLGQRVTAEVYAVLRGMPERDVGVIPFVANTLEDVERVNAYREMDLVIAQCNAGMDEKGQLEDDWIEARHGERWLKVMPGDVDYVELMPRQVVSASTSMIPFLEHDDANRALMGCNMQRQAVPLLKPQTALVTTGMEVDVARDSGYQVRAESGGVVTAVSADRIDVMREDGVVDTYELLKARRSNAFTWISQTPAVNRWQRVGEGDVLADGHASREGELALGQRVLVAYMSWDGYNYEDAIILSDRVVRDGKFRSRILKRFRLDAVDVSLVEHDEDGKDHIRKVRERITRDVPDVAEWRKKLLGEDGIVPVGTYVKPGQILVGRASPKPTPADLQGREMPGEQKLLFAIFGETADQVRYSDKSLLLPKGQQGRVVRVNVIRKDDDSEASKQLPPGCHTRVEVEVAGTRSVQPGDKMSGRHGNKGCVSIVVPQEDMPFLPDGTPIDVMLSPLGVPSRMNLGQLMEVHLGWAAHRLGFRARTSVFDSATWDEVEQCMAQAWLAGRAGGIGNRIAEDDMHSVDWSQVKHWCKKEGHSFDRLFGEAATRGTEPGRVCLSLWLEDEGLDVPAGLTYEQLRARVIEIDRLEDKAGPIMGKQVLRDGRTGERMGKPVMVGYKYMIKLGHMVEDKMHARSTGTYSSITQQPLRGKSAGGGQRVGEMEVWALEGYSAAYILQEMLTLKSDDVEGRRMTLDAIMAGGGTGLAKTTRILPNVPDSFNLLCAELRSMGMDVRRVNEEISYIYEEPNLGLSEESYANEMES